MSLERVTGADGRSTDVSTPSFASSAAGCSLARVRLEDKEVAYHARQRRNRVTGLVVAASLVAGTVGLAHVVVHPLVVVVGVVASMFSVMGALGCLAPVQTPWLIVVLDRRVPRPPPRTGDVDTHGAALFLFRADLDALARASGVPPLGLFMGAIRAGAAKHHPDEVIPSVDALLAGRERLPDTDRLVGTLEDLKDRLLAAKENGARVCLTETTVWSGAIETNLGLHWYA